MSSNNKKIPVINNINSLNAQILYLIKKKKTKPTPTPSETPNIYQISFVYDEEFDEINPADHKNEYGFNIDTDFVGDTVRVSKTIRNLVYCDGEKITYITPKLYSKAVDIKTYEINSDNSFKTHYNIYVYIPFKSKDIEKNVWAGYKTIKSKYETDFFPNYILTDGEFNG